MTATPDTETAAGHRGTLHAPTEARWLAGVAGSVDAIGVLTLGGLFVAHMSGNSAAFGAAFGQGDWLTAARHFFAIPVFVFGLFLGYLWILKSRTFRRCAILLATEAALLLIFCASVYFRLGYLAAVPALLAMGLQNSALRELGRSSFPTTYVTGVLDALSKATATAVLERNSEPLNLARSAASVWISYAMGAVLGSTIYSFIGSTVILIPAVLLALLAIRFAKAEPLFH